MLSKRSSIFLGEPEFLVKCMLKCAEDEYDSETNPSGRINLGTAVNALVEDLIEDRLKKSDVFTHKREWQHYFGLNGTPDLLHAAASFLTKRVTRGEVTMSPGNIRLVNGVSGGLEALSWILADTGEVILVPVPTYARFFADMNERMKTEVVGIHLEDGFVLTPGLLERSIQEQLALGKRVKGFLFCNPNNPLGDIYSLELAKALMRVCAKHGIHFISDEIYALSIFNADKGSPFKSVLTIPENELPDPERTHFMWGLSKDFGLAGFRMGFIHSYSKDLLQCLDGSCIYTCVPTHQQHMAATLLGDDLWLDNKFFPENIRRLSEAHSHTVNTLGEIGIKAFRAKAGLFVWLDFRKYLKEATREFEMDLFQRLFNDHNVYIVPGSEFGCTEFGWFRIIFSVTPKKLEVALDRIKRALLNL